MFHAVSGANDRIRTGEIYDVEATGTELYTTLMHALEASPTDVADRMRSMREHLRSHDIRAWVHGYLTALDRTGSLAARLTA